MIESANEELQAATLPDARTTHVADFLAGGGEMGALMNDAYRAHLVKPADRRALQQVLDRAAT